MQSNEFAPEGGGSCGARLKQAREAAGLSIEDVAARLKMPSRVVLSLENDDTGSAGAPVFVRGQLRSYARLVGIDLEDQLSGTPLASTAPSELISHTHTPRYRRVFEQTTRRAIYIVMTAAIAVPVILATRPHLSNSGNVQSLEMPANLAGAEHAVAQVAARSATAAATPPQRTPLVASMAPALSHIQASKTLTLNFTGESWMQVRGTGGQVLDEGTVQAGQTRSYNLGEVGYVKLGNASGVEVRKTGESVDLAPFSRGSVARFTLSSDGSLAPASN
ncbi:MULTISPECIES: RodZ domain-containing protein [Lysobacter]|uniref:RodZ domain-containing protein n=1 Tax=Lysobacter TaxID=68 RepID=UPI0004D01FCC|nr:MULTISPECIES: RodZ domain-containing protein [Lysobacter]